MDFLIKVWKSVEKIIWVFIQFCFGPQLKAVRAEILKKNYVGAEFEYREDKFFSGEKYVRAEIWITRGEIFFLKNNYFDCFGFSSLKLCLICKFPSN